MSNNIKKSAVSLLLASTLALTGCKGSTNNNDKEKTLDETITISDVVVKENSIKEVVIDNKIVSVSDLRLADKDNNIINKVDAVLSGNRLVSVSNIPFIKFNSNIEYILVGDEILPVSSLKLVNVNTKEEVKTIDYAIVNNELVPFKNVVIGSKEDSSKIDLDSKDNFKFDYSNSAVITTNEDYKEFTTEEFEKLCAKKIKDFEDLGLEVKREDVIKYVMVFNIDKLKQDNKELVKEIIGDQVTIEVIDDAYRVSNVIESYEGRYLIDKGEMFSVADVIYDDEQREIVKKFEARKLAIINANASEREEMFIQLCQDIYDPVGEFSKLEDASRMLMFRHALVVLHSTYFTNRSTYLTELSGYSKELVFRLIAPYGASQDEIINSIMSGYERNMMASFAECIDNVKTLTK